MIQLHRLEGFYWVVKTGGYSKAARAFPYPITQPAVHQQVKKLEDELGITLLERIGKDYMKPSPAGQMLFEFVRPFFEGLDAILRVVKSGEYGGEFHIQAQGLILRHILPAWLKRLQRKRPGIQIQLREMEGIELEPLQKGDTDLAIGIFETIPNDIAAIKVAILHPFLVLPREHTLARKTRIRLEELHEDSFISYNKGHLAYRLQMQVLAEHGLHPREVISAGSAETILGFVEAGLGYSFVPSLDPKGPKVKGVVARAIKAPQAEFPVMAAWRKDSPENALLDAALETAPKA